MESLRSLLKNALRAERWERIQRVLEGRLGTVRVVAENLHHPHNMSALLRTCEAFGVQYVHAVESVEEFTVSRRITLGAHKWLTLTRHETMEQCAAALRGAGVRLYAAMLDPTAIPLEELPVADPIALVFGNEKQGVSAKARAACDGAYTIPMAGFVQSLNISVAAVISIYSVTQRVRRARPDGGLLTDLEKERLLEAWLPKSLRCGPRIVRAVQPPSRG